MRLNRLLLLVCLFSIAVYAQNAEVSGAVQDPTGAVIPKASVEFRNQDTGIRRQVKTNGDGVYQIEGIDPGKYDATVDATVPTGIGQPCTSPLTFSTTPEAARNLELNEAPMPQSSPQTPKRTNSRSSGRTANTSPMTRSVFTASQPTARSAVSSQKATASSSRSASPKWT